MSSIESAAATAVSDPAVRRTDLAPLHPVMRNAISRLLEALQSEGLPFRVFEAYRGPLRQDWLYRQGRSRPGSIVTYAQAWDSYHQYGLAADVVLWINNSWNWSTEGVNAARWERLHTLGKTMGLEPLRFETPHLQIAGLSIRDLRAGKFPDCGHDPWRDNLEGAIISWLGKPPAPPIASLRPALPAESQTHG
jgi:peptidoglycan L-alanyl-D-glutamate endopeptidase CwlK